MSDRFEVTWAVVTGLLCALVMLGLAFTGLLALAGVAVVLAVSLGVRGLLRFLARSRPT